MDKRAINFVFAEIRANEAKLDSAGQFSGWDDANVFNQDCYFSVQVTITEKLLSRRTKSDLMSLFEPIIKAMKTTTQKLRAIY